MFLPNEWAPAPSIEPVHRLSPFIPETFLEAVRSSLKLLIPASSIDGEALFHWLHGQLPLIWWPTSEEVGESYPSMLPIHFLYPAQFATDLERYVADTLHKRLFTEAKIPVVGQMGLCFYFVQNPNAHYFCNQQLVGVRDLEEKRALQKLLELLSQEMRLTMSSLCQGRSLRINKAMHPTFMPRNEEELLKNLVLLSKELQFVRDLPQVSIHYERQSDTHLIFIVLLVRLRIGTVPCVHLLFADRVIRCEVDEVRILGQLRRKYPKEAAILHVFVEKSLFFRPDYSVDLLRARQRVAAELASALGEFRDFNGGMILKQEETLSELRKWIGPLSQQNELLLDNYFYSLRPVIAQTVHDPLTLKSHFALLLENMHRPLPDSGYALFSEREGDYELYFLFASQSDAKKVTRELKKEPYLAVTTLLILDGVTALGWIAKKERIDWLEKVERIITVA